MTGDERAPGVVDAARLGRFPGRLKQCFSISFTIPPRKHPSTACVWVLEGYSGILTTHLL